MKRRIALLLVFCMLTTMLPPALAEEIVRIPNGEDAALELPGDADGIVEEESPVLELEDIDLPQLDLGDLEQTDVESEDQTGEAGAADAAAQEGDADNAASTGVPKKLTLGQKQTYALDASEVSGGKKVTYKSSKAAVAAVSAKGVITAKKNGTAKITVVVGKKTVATCTVTVVNAPNKVTLPDDSIELDVKSTYQIKPKLPSKTMASFTYSSKDKKIARVDKDGLVTGVKIGTTTITVKTHNNKTATLDVTVKATEPTEAAKVTLSQTKATLSTGDTLQLTATLPKGTASVLTWTSDKPDVATVNDFGLVTAVDAGTAKITVETANGKKASCTVTVKKAPSKVTLKPDAVTLAPGESIQLKATLPKGTTSELTWKSAKSAVAKVNENGLVTAVKVGTARITVETYNGKKDTCVVTVKKNGGEDDAKAPKKVTLDETKATLSVGDTLQLVATLPAGTVSSLTWTSDNPKVAKVKSTGLVTAVDAGTAKITVATANGKKATCALTVKKAPESVTLNAHELIIGVDETFLLRATLQPKDATSELTFKSNKPSVVRVNEDGMMTAVKAGTAKITVETYNGKKDTCKVTVEKAALLRAYTDQDSFTVKPTEKVKLEVKTEVRRDPELSYKWFQDSTEIAGATGSEYTVTAGNVGSYAYRCVISDGDNSEEVAFAVTVTNDFTAEAGSAAEQTVYTEQTATLTAKVECAVGEPTYQWYEGDTAISGATSASYAVTKADAGVYTYKCVVVDGYGSAAATLAFTVNVKARTLTSATAAQASFSLKPADRATLKVNVTTDGEPGLTYKWTLGETEITGATAAEYTVTAGNVGRYAYRCVVTDDSAARNSRTVDFTVTVDNGFAAEASSATAQTVFTGKAATLSVSASATTNDKLTYQWYEGDTAIGGATSASYAATKADAGVYTYRCAVSDGYGSAAATVEFTVTVKEPTLTGATAQAASQTVAPKGTATLKVNATVDGEPGLTYQWYEGESTQPIADADADSYTVTAGDVGSYAYRCVVTDDSTNKNSRTVDFTVTVNNGFAAEADGETELTVYTGKTATMAVTASATTDDKISYQWYEGDTAISGATSASYTTDAIADVGVYTYKCVVNDGYGSAAATVEFTVTVKEPTLTGATAQAASQTVAPKGTATLKVNATVDGEPTLSYAWYEGESTQPIADATSDSYTVTAGNVGSYAYRCVVTDDSTAQNSETVNFTVTVANGFAAEADGETAQTVYIGQTATMAVTASATTDDSISYQWYAGENAISGETDASYTTDAIDDAGVYTYRCAVSDGYGSADVTVEFTVTVKAPSLTGATADEASLTVAPTQTATLKVVAECDGEPSLSYAWYEGESTEPIAGAETDSYTVTAGNVGEYAYSCKVSDGTNTEEVTFAVTVDNGLTASAVGNTQRNVRIGEGTTLEVDADCVTGNPTFQWYAGDEAIEGVTEDRYTTPAIEADATYKCVVGDGYGSQTLTVEFAITAVEEIIPAEGIQINEQNFPDPVFRGYVGDFDEDEDGALSAEEIAAVTEFDHDYGDLTDLTGIEYFTSLETLNCSCSSGLKSLNVRQNKQLVYLYVNDCGLTSLDVSKNTLLEELYCQNTGLTELDISNCPNLIEAAMGDPYTGDGYLSYDERLQVDEGVQLIGVPERPQLDPPTYTLNHPEDSIPWGSRLVLAIQNKPEDIEGLEYSAKLHVPFEDGEDTWSMDLNGKYDASADTLTFENWYGDFESITGDCTLTVTVSAPGCVKGTVTRTVGIAPQFDNELQLKAVGKTQILTTAGKRVELAVTVNCLQGEDDLTLQWSKWTTVRYEEEGDSWEEETWKAIEGANSTEYAIESVSEDGRYRCEVRDAYGNYRDVTFDIILFDAAKAKPLALGEAQTVSIEGYNGDYELFSFKPETSGLYAFIGDEAHNDYMGKYGTLLDADLKQISTEDQSTSYKLMCKLTAGAQYYFMAGYTPGFGDGAYDVVLERIEALDNIRTLTLGENAAVNIAEGGQTVYFSYTPVETGYYAFSSKDTNGDSTIGCLYDENGQAIEEETGWSEFDIRHQLTQGKTYYFGARFNNDETQGSYTVCLEGVQGLVSADAEQPYFTVEPNTEVTLRVNAVCTEGETLTYQWYLGNAEEPISDANGSTYAVTVTRSNNYRCVVSDTRGQTKEVRFSAHVENELKARVKDSEDWNTEVDLTASMKEKVSLEVEASCKNGTPHYQWYEDGYEIEGANSSAYTTKQIHSERTEVSCIVSDDYGNTNWVNFHIDCDNYVDNNLQASAENENINVSPADTATLKVNATAVDMEGVTYSWSYQSKALNDAGGLDAGEWVPIEDATGATCILDGTDMYTTSYSCEVADQYEAVQTVYFNVTVENGLDVNADTESTVHPTAYNTSATLVVTADAIDKTGLAYTWVEVTYGEGEDGRTVRAVEGGNTSTLVTDPLIRESRFECRVVDRFWNSAEFGFSVSVPNGLTVSAANNETTILVLSGQPAVLAVEASCLNGQDQLRYRWERFEGKDEWGGEMWQPIDSADTPEYRIEAVTENTRARCEVKDICNNTKWVDFTVNVVDPNNVTALTLGEPQNVSIEGYDGKYELFSFKPETSGLYAFIGDEAHNDYMGKYGTLLDADLEQISTEDQSMSYKLMCKLTAGAQYYFMAGYTQGYGDGAYDVVLERIEALDNIRTLTLGENAAVNIAEGGQTVYFSYTPTETGYYIFSSDYDGTNGTFGTLYDGHFQELRGESGYNNFSIIQRLDSENTYYFGARFSDETVVDSFTVSLKAYEGLISANAAESSFTVAPNTEVTLQVNAEYTDGESLTYRWYEDGGYDTASESTVSTYTLNATRATIYRCEVKDTHGNTRSVSFWVNIENSFTASAIGEIERTASMRDTVKLEVEASCEVGDPSYQWYEAFSEIEGANSAAYTTKPIHRERTEVYCHVSDDYGNTRDVWFYIDCDNYVENNLQASAVSDYLSVTPEETVTLEASVTANDLADATAQWFYRPRTLNDQGEWDEGEWVDLGAPEAITAEDGQATLTRALGEGELHTTGYRCEIVDKYGNTADTGFNVTVETGLSMTWDYEHSSFSVASGAAATLTSQMQKNWEPTTVTGLDYTWYRRNGDYYEIIDGQTGASYTIPSVTRREDYKCVAVDAYWNLYASSDYVGVQNDLSVRAANGETIFAVPYGGQVTLAVEASCTEGQDALQYKWSGQKLTNGDEVAFTEATNGSYVINTVTEDWAYRCDITDIYGNTSNVEFSVTIIDPNDAESLTANSPVTSVPEGIWAEGILWSYTPQETGSYIFRVTGNSTGMPVYCALYNADMNKITRAEKYSDATLAVNLTGGEEYFFKAGYTIRYGGEDPITVELISMSNASALTLGEAVAVNLTEGGQIVCFSFTPVQTGRYVFESFTDGDSYEDTYGILYDGNMQEIANDDSTGENGHFKLVHELSADTTYYFATRYYNCNGKGAFSVRLTTEE